MDDWKKIEPGNAWNYKEEGENATLEGVYVSKEEHVGENDSIVYTFKVNGDFVNVWGSTLLDVRLKNVEPGEEVKIVYLGSQPSEKRKGKTYHNFDVYHRQPPMQKVSTPFDEEPPHGDEDE